MHFRKMQLLKSLANKNWSVSFGFVSSLRSLIVCFFGIVNCVLVLHYKSTMITAIQRVKLVA